jgi:putative PEP-CTERM system histidine kinase
VTQEFFAVATAWSYGLAVAVYLAFAAHVGISARRAKRGRLLAAALLGTATWAAGSLLVGLRPSATTFFVSGTTEAVRLGAWFLFLANLLARTQAPLRAGGTRNAAIAVAAALIASVLLYEGAEVTGTTEVFGLRGGFLLRLGLAVFGLVLIEQVFRRVMPQTRWSVKPLVIGLGGVFGLELLYYADAMLFGRIDPELWMARGFANVIVVPFLAIATARNTGWTVDLHVSRGAVFHSSALLASGAFLLLVAGAGYMARYFGGEWGRALQIELLFGAILFVVLGATSGRFRSKLKVFVSKHFFSYRYDYREEWLRLTRALSTESAAQSLQERTVMALANLVESPSGVLWLNEGARGYLPSARWNMPMPSIAESGDGALVSFMTRTEWIVSIPEVRLNPERYEGVTLPAWMAAFPDAWLIVPLLSRNELLGYVVLSVPRTPITLDWEVRDLLKTASRQAASYLGHVKATEELLETRKFDAFNRMSAFVVHDLKNLIAQLSLMLKNAERHRENPRFQADMLTTVQHVVEKMNALMIQLRIGNEPVDKPRAVDPQAVLKRICAAKSLQPIEVVVEATVEVAVIAHEDRLEHVLGHLIQNAIDASTPPGRVDIRIGVDDRFATITISDSGVGMSDEFIRDSLFKPFQTTKQSGMGIGVYESAQYVQGLGGELKVESRVGRGTSVRLKLLRAHAAAAARDEAATVHAL